MLCCHWQRNTHDRQSDATRSCNRCRGSHHVTQRGNAGRFILQDESDCKVYLDLRQSTEFQWDLGVAPIWLKSTCSFQSYLA